MRFVGDFDEIGQRDLNEFQAVILEIVELSTIRSYEGVNDGL